MIHIRVLDVKTINQIAAGEVVERPASVVKELLENALDAGARSVSIEIQEGGLKLIRVADDGEGLSPENAQRAVEKHATSKIQSVDDLTQLRTFGFRGEALSSIAAVSHFELTSKTQDAEVGVSIRVRDGGHIETKPHPRPPGTTVTVNNLFFNTPARLKFMKKTTTETDRCALVVPTYALAFPNVGFRLSVDNRKIVDSPQGTDETRRQDLFGRDLAKHLLPVSFQAGPLSVEGAVSEPALTRPTRESLYLFVNRRWVMNPALFHAVMTAYQTLLPSRRFPAGALFLTIPPEEVDVNIHPTKREVKFAHDRAVYDAIVQAVRQTLLNAPLGPGSPAGSATPPSSESPYAVLRDNAASMAAEPAPMGVGDVPVTLSSAPPPGSPWLTAARLGHSGTTPRGMEMEARRLDPELTLYNFAQYFNTFIVFQSDSELFIADQHTVHERLNFEKILREGKNGRVESQPLLVPSTFDLAPREAAVLSSHLELLAEFGLEVEPFGGNTFVVKSVPSDLSGKDPAPLVRDLTDQIAQDEAGGVQDENRLAQLRRRAASFLSCRSAVMAGDRLNEEQMRGLIDRMRRENIPFTCPHGRPTLMAIPLGDLYRKFDRH